MDRHLPGKKWIFRQKVYFCHGRYGSSQTVCFCDTYKKRKKSGDSERNAAFFAKEIGIYCETLTKNMRKQQNTTKSDRKILG